MKITVDEDDGQLNKSRIIAKVICGNTDLNAALIYNGLGKIDTRYCSKSEFANEEWAREHGCKPRCENECSYNGQKKCEENYVKICGNFDVDEYLEWKTTEYCEYGCINGKCNQKICTPTCYWEDICDEIAPDGCGGFCERDTDGIECGDCKKCNYGFCQYQCKGNEKCENNLCKQISEVSDGIICSYNAYNCSDFKTREEAQKVFEYCGGVNNDIHYLDADKDGIACESLLPEPETEILQPQIPSIPSVGCEGVICSYNAYNCSDFSTHDEAQRIYECCGGATNDIHRLDRDKDGLACESLL